MDSPETAAEGVVSGEADVVLVAGRPPQVPAEIVEEYQRDPALQDRLVFGPRDVMIYLSMNLATPPFDDVHVRKAVNLAVDKATLLGNVGGRPAGDLAGHVVLDSFEDNLLHEYDPYATPEGRGDVDRAREEMAQSAYDHDGDGICDDQVCRDVLAVAPVFPRTPTQDQAESVRSNLEALGIELDLQLVDVEEGFTRLFDPAAKVALGIEIGWGKDFPSASAWVSPLFTAAGIGYGNHSLVGADSEELRRWGYEVKSVPTIEEKANECQPLFGDEATRCYAELDQQLMEQVVPWVPLRVENQAFVLSRRVLAHSFDQFTSLAALDRIALSQGRS